MTNQTHIGNIEDKSMKEGLQKDGKTPWTRWAFKVVGQSTMTLSIFEDEKNAEMIRSAKVGMTKLFEYTEKENPQGGASYKTAVDIREPEGQAIPEETITAPTNDSAPAQVVQPQRVQAASQPKQLSEYDKFWEAKRILEGQGASERLLTSCLIQACEGMTKPYSEADLEKIPGMVQKLFIGVRKVKTNLQENNTW